MPSKQTIFLSLALASLLVIQGVGIWGEREEAEAVRWRQHSVEALLAISSIRECTRLNEVRFREYLLSGEEEAANRVGVGLADSRKRRAFARDLMRDNPGQLKQLDRLDAALARVAGTLVRLVDARRAEGAEAAGKLVAAAGIPAMSEAAEGILTKLVEEEDHLLAERQARAKRLALVTSITTKSGGLLTLLFGGLAWHTLRRHARAREAADAEKLAAVTQFRGLMESSPDAIWISQQDRVVYANPAFARLLGHASPAHLIGRSPFEFVRPDFHEHTRGRAKALDAGQRVEAAEIVYVRSNGVQIPVEVSAVPAMFNGQPCAQVIARDLSERKRAEQALRDSEARYRTLFNSIDEGFCVIEMIFDEQEQPADYRFIELNPSFEKQTGMRDALGKRMLELAPLHEQHWFDTYGRIAVTGEAVRFQNRAEALGRWYDVFAFRFGEPKLRQVAILFNDITASKAAAATLQASQENLAVTLQSIGDGVLTTDAEGRVTRLNAVAESLTGWKQAEAVGRPVAEVFRLIAEGSRGPVFLPVAETLAKGTIHGLANHTMLVARDGTERPIADSCAPIRNAEGRVIGAVLVFRDVSEQRRAEQLLAKSMQEIQDLYNHAPCGYHSVDTAGVFVAVNDTELAWFGRTREELIGKRTHRDLVTPDTQAAYDEGFACFKQHGEVRDLEFKIARPDGTVMDMLLNATGVRDASGRLLHSRSTMFDITRRKQAEAALRASEDNLRVTLQSIGDGVLVTDAAGCVTRINQVAETLTGWTQAEAQGRPVAEVFHIVNEETRQPAFLPVADTLAKGTIHGLANHTVLIARDGRERPIADSCAPIRHGERVLGAVLVFRDVTEEQAAEVELRRSRAVFQNLFESLPGLFLVLTTELRIAAVSDAYLNATMTRREEIMGRGLFDVFPDNPGDAGATGTTKLRASLNRVLLEGVTDTMAIQKYDVQRPDGTFEERYWSPVNSPVFGADQRIEYVIHRVEDVTAFMRQKQQPTPEETVMLTRMEQMEAEIYRSAQAVQSAKEELEQRVKERTAELVATNRELLAEISAREQSQLALRAAETKFRTLVEQSLVGIYVIQDGRLLYVNPRLEEILGYSAEGLTSRPVLDFIHEADRSLAQENFRRRLEGEVQSIHYQLRMTRQDGAVIHVEVHGARSEFNGRPAILGTLLDITEQKQAELRLGAERQLLRTLIDHLPSYIFVKDAAGRYLVSNLHHTRLLGAETESQLLGRTVFDFFPPEIARGFMTDDELLLQKGEPVLDREDRYEAGAAQGWHAVTKVPLRDAQGQVLGLIGIRHDISARKRAEEELKFYTASLERSNRELQDFASVASHDLQEPLRKIQAFSDRLKARSQGLDETGRDYLDRMQNAAARMQTLVNDLLTFSRVTTRAQPFVQTDLAKVASEVLTDLETRIEQTKGRVEVAALPVIEADATQMRQLLQNLLANALKFRRADEPSVVKVYCEREGDGVRLCVADNGIGFDEKYLDRIFTIFQRLHGREEYEGTGVGLAVCRKIAHRHAGSITARSQPGQGATFIVTLPVRQLQPGAPI